jgi:D-3-phosphoglycerate dehydrogenase
MERPIVIFADVQVEGPMLVYLDELLDCVRLLHPRNCSPDEMEAARGEALAWIGRSQPLRRTDLDAMPAVKLISAWGVGYNHIDVNAATERGIPVCVNPVFSRSMAESALALVLALSKRLTLLMRDARDGKTPDQNDRGIEIKNRSLGMIGFGRIGKETGELARRLEMRVLACDPYLPAAQFPSWCRPASLAELLSTADFVLITTPLTAETHHLIGSPELAMMKPTAYLINLARGKIVNEAALFDALQRQKIAGAALDVWEQEPLDPANPLLALDNVIPTPHKIGATWDSLEAVCRTIQSNVLRVLVGEHPEHVINPQIYDDPTAVSV